jgi:hypothetical protein
VNIHSPDNSCIFNSIKGNKYAGHFIYLAILTPFEHAYGVNMLFSTALTPLKRVLDIPISTTDMAIRMIRAPHMTHCIIGTMTLTYMTNRIICASSTAHMAHQIVRAATSAADMTICMVCATHMAD